MSWVVLLAALGLSAANERDIAASPSEVQAALLDSAQPMARWQLSPAGEGTRLRYLETAAAPARTMAALTEALALQARFDVVTARLEARRAHATGFNMGGARPRRMANCPSAVDGARTSVSDVPGGVDVLVIAGGSDAREEIRRRAARQVEATQIFLRGGDEHAGLGNGSGRFGFCPGIAPETSLSADVVPGGVRLRVRAYRRASVPILRRVTRERAGALAGRS